ncbi:MAG: hypothetical protein HZA91_02790, partial [Verrucomicrobia bacterium]|nr:hypothetical protein [Verrucomicrobiota bacterium]
VAAETNPVTNGGFEDLEADGRARDWAYLVAPPNIIAPSRDAHAGSLSLLLKRAAPGGEVGFNRAGGAGKQGAMLSQLKGGLLFWYKVFSASPQTQFQFHAIAMDARPHEVERATFNVPREHVGDGQWHRAVIKYDFTGLKGAKWVHAAARIVGDAGEMLADDASYVPQVGPLLAVKSLVFDEDRAKPGELGTLTATIANNGDTVAQNTEAALTLPEGLTATPGLRQTLPAIAADSDGKLKWTVTGRRERAATLHVTAKAGESQDTATFLLAPDLRVIGFAPDRFVLWRGATTPVAATISNAGHAIAPALRATLSAAAPVRVTGAAELQETGLLPGQSRHLCWTVQAEKATGGAALSLAVNGAGTNTTTLLAFERGAGDKLVIANGPARLLFEPTAGGYGPCQLQLKRGLRWQTLATMPYLGRVVWQEDGGARRETLLPGKLTGPGELTAERDGWRLAVKFTPIASQLVFAARYTLTAAAPRKLLAFDGPMLYAGEGNGCIAKTDALFPGLEWLVGGEESSSALDFAPDHPDRVRYVPHPAKVTIPLMAVRSAAGAVGLLWRDAMGQQPVFASPDNFEHRNGHLMGLMLPTVADGLPENARECIEPVAMPAGAARAIEAEIFVQRDAPDALAAMDLWFKRNGVPEPMPIPRGSYIAEVAFSTRAYMQTLWDEEGQGWWPYRGGPALNNKVAPRPDFCFDLLMASRLLPESKPELSAKCLGRANRIAEKAGFAPHTGDDLQFASGNAFTGVESLAQAAASAMSSQRDDGSWRFDADRKDEGVFKGYDYHELGADDAAELGTCARNAYTALRLARITGDGEALAAGLRALRFMQRFTVPRAAQVWEVPVHSPDILAASDAIEACLEAWWLTGDAAHLAQARRWARAGLPFVYQWNPPDKPWLRHASIAVFGASWMKWSWIGRPVQWNGLRYANALLKLTPHDTGFPWQRVAEGILRSAMYQQSTDEKDIALWPDSVGAIDGKKSGWIFAPRHILTGVYRLLGHDEEPSTLIMRRGAMPLLVTSRARFDKVTDGGGWVSFELEFPADEPGPVMIAGVAKPSDVIVDGKPANEFLGSDARGLHVLRFSRDGRHSVRLGGVRSQPVVMLPRLATAIDFDFSRGLQGWLAAHDLEPLATDGGALATRAKGRDPYLIRPSVRVAGDSVGAIKIRMAVSSGRNAQLFWSTQEQPGFDEPRSIHFVVTDDGKMRDYSIPVGGHALWRGKTITGLRLDPAAGPPGSTIRIERISAEPR